jgi:class 3 adenylate cyclase
MEPQIQYVRSADGTRIAMSTIGRGRPLVVDTGLVWATMEAFGRIPNWREGVERLAERRLVVHYDNRGRGLSDREVTDFSLDARLNDLTAVIDRLDAPEVDLLSFWGATQTAIRYAAEHPDRVRRMILRNPVIRGRDLGQSALQRALRPLLEADWPTYARCMILEGFGWEIGQELEQFAIDGVSPEAFIASGHAVRETDVSEYLPGVRCPTLVLRPRQVHPALPLRALIPLEVFKQLTEAIPAARMVNYDGQSTMMLADEVAVDIVEQFLDEEDGEQMQDLPVASGTAVILFADIADSTALTERLGDTAFRAKARELASSLRTLIRDCAGTPIEGPTLGDGVLAAFTSAREAIEAALRCNGAAQAIGLSLHLGLHAGDVTSEKDPDGRNNVYGGAVNIAARISGLSAPGEVLVSDTVRSLARTSAGVTFEDRGEQSLKGVGDAVRIYAVSATDNAR